MSTRGGAAALDSALDAAADRLGRRAADRAAARPGSPGQLRRRFHELGAANPYAVDEYAELQGPARDARDAGDRTCGRRSCGRAS